MVLYAVFMALAAAALYLWLLTTFRDTPLREDQPFPGMNGKEDE